MQSIRSSTLSTLINLLGKSHSCVVFNNTLCMLWVVQSPKELMCTLTSQNNKHYGYYATILFTAIVNEATKLNYVCACHRVSRGVEPSTTGKFTLHISQGLLCKLVTWMDCCEHSWITWLNMNQLRPKIAVQNLMFQKWWPLHWHAVIAAIFVLEHYHRLHKNHTLNPAISITFVPVCTNSSRSDQDYIHCPII